MKLKVAALLALVMLVMMMISVPALARSHHSTGGYNDIVSFGHGVTVQPGQEVGDLVVMGGGAEVSGHVHGDAIVFGGSLHITPEGQVDGDTVAFGGGVDNESRVRSGAAESPAPETPMPEETPAPIETSPPIENQVEESHGPSAWTIILILDTLLTLVAFALFPVRSDHSLEQLQQQPLLSVVLGFLSPLILATAVVVLAATVLGIPLIPVVILAYYVAYLIGKAGISLFLGRRFLELAKVQEPRPIVAVLLGLIVLLLITAATPLWFAIPVASCIGCVAVGAAMVSFIRMRPSTGMGAPVMVTATPPGSSGPPAVPQ